MSNVVYEIVFPEGYEAGKQGYSRESNPYQNDSRDYLIWHEGWEEGHQKWVQNTLLQEPKVKKGERKRNNS